MTKSQVMKTYKSLNNWHNFRIRLFGEGVLVGIFAGLAICLFRFLLDLAEKGRTNIYAHLNASSILLNALWFVGLLLIAGVLYFFCKHEPMAAGSGIPQVKGVILGAIKMRWLRVLWVKITAGVIGIGAGLSLGREGPSIQLGAVTAQGVSRMLGRTRLEEKYLITSGASAGLAAAFNAPLAGVIFALEELHRNFSAVVLLPAMAAAMTATIISRIFFGEDTIFNFTNLAVFPLEHTGYIVLVAIFAGVAGVIFNWGLLNINKFYSLPIFTTQYHKIIFALICAGFLGFYLPEVLGGGNELINHLASTPVSLKMLVVLLLVKFLFTLFSYGSGVPGGFFLPMLVLGALTGAISAYLLISWEIIQVAYAANIVIIAMAAFFTASVRAPITGTVLIMEMTGSFQHMMVLAIASTIAYITAELLGGKPIYEELLTRMLGNTPDSEAHIHEERNIIEVAVCSGSSIENKQIKDIDWPPQTLLVDVKRGEAQIVPDGNTYIRAGDFLYVLTKTEYVSKVIALGEEIQQHHIYGDY